MSDKVLGSVMVVGGGIAGMQASLDLANCRLLSSTWWKKARPSAAPWRRSTRPFPPMIAPCELSPPSWSRSAGTATSKSTPSTELLDVTGEPGNLKVTLDKQARYVDLEKCTGCGECAKVCPVTIQRRIQPGPGTTNQAIYRLYPQAIPSAFTIDKLDRAPCTLTCPAQHQCPGLCPAH